MEGSEKAADGILEEAFKVNLNVLISLHGSVIIPFLIQSMDWPHQCILAPLPL